MHLMRAELRSTEREASTLIMEPSLHHWVVVLVSCAFDAHSESIHHGDCFCIYYPPLELVLDTTLVTLNMIAKALATELSPAR